MEHTRCVISDKPEFVGARPAYYRFHHEQPIICMDFGPLGDESSEERAVLPAGLHTIPFSEALDSLDAALALNVAEVVVAKIDWLAFIENDDRARPLFRNREVEVGLQAPEVVSRYLSVRTEERSDVVRSYVLSQYRRLSHLGPQVAIDHEEAFAELGLTAADLRALNRFFTKDLECYVALPSKLITARSSIN